MIEIWNGIVNGEMILCKYYIWEGIQTIHQLFQRNNQNRTDLLIYKYIYNSVHASSLI
jgi:hypothetical protein